MRKNFNVTITVPNNGHVYKSKSLYDGRDIIISSTTNNTIAYIWYYAYRHLASFICPFFGKMFQKMEFSTYKQFLSTCLSIAKTSGTAMDNPVSKFTAMKKPGLSKSQDINQPKEYQKEAPRQNIYKGKGGLLMDLSLKNRRIINAIAFMAFILFGIVAKAQTPGLIYDPATGYGRTVLDRNGDGYSSATTAGFTTNDVTQSEMLFTPIPQLNLEPNGDILRGPNCGFTDFNDNGSKDAVSMRFDSSAYLIFRFRMSNTAKNSKGYSILVDADGKFGSSGPYADPNYVSGNPGFEFEIVLETNFRVAIYSCDGTTSYTLVKSYDGHTNYQKSIALNSTSCGTGYFYDFFVKIADLPSPYNNSTTAFRYAINTVMSPHSALQGPISDVGGVNDNTYGNNATTMWTQLVTSQTGTTAANTNSGLGTLMTIYPTVYGPIYSGATSVTVFNNDPSTASITIYKIHAGVTTTLGTVSTVSTESTGTLSGISALSTGDQIYAVATASGKSVSLNSNTVTVSGCANKYTAPLFTCISSKGIEGTTVYPGATIKLYTTDGRLITTVTSSTTATGGLYAWAWDPNGTHTKPCNQGSPNTMLYGSVMASVAASGTFCESNLTTSPSISTCTPVAAPTNVTINYSTNTVSGSSGTSDSIAIFKNNVLAYLTKASSGAWSKTGSFSSSDTILVAAYAGGNSSCLSARVLAINPPIISSTLKNGGTSVSGTSDATPGTTINVYNSGGTLLGTTTVDNYGNWSATVSALTTGTVVYATATEGTYTSANSNNVTVVAAASTIVPTITGSYSEGGTSVSGTLPSAQTGTINLYEDGTFVRSVSITAASSWTITGISSTLVVAGTPTDNYLYAGGNLTATFTPSSGGTESALSTSVQVQCVSPTQTQTVTASAPAICYNTTGTVNIFSSESGTIYTLVDHSNHATTLSSSAVGTGGTISLTTYALTANTIVDVQALKIGPVTCSNYLTDTALVRVNVDPTISLTVGASSNSICSGSSVNITLAASESGVVYQLRDASNNNIGSTLIGNGATLIFPSGALTSSTTFNILATKTTFNVSCNKQVTQTQSVTVTTVTTATAGSNQTSVCNTGTMAANTPTSGTGAWSVVSGAGTFTSASSPTTTVTAMGHGTNVYRWTITNGSCSTSATVNITTDCAATYTATTYSSGHTFHSGDVIETVTDPDGIVTAAALLSGTLPPGTTLNASTGKITINAPSSLVNGAYNFSVLTTDQYGGQTTSPITYTFVNPVPVTLISFSGNRNNHVVNLVWETASEINNDHFNIERSTDGSTFEKVGVVAGNGTVQKILNYHFSDNNAPNQLLYYRLKQVDFNGAFEYTNVISIQGFEQAPMVVNVYPNPITKGKTLHIDITCSSEENISIALTDIWGNVLFTENALAIENKQTIEINTGKLSSGVYFVKMQSPEGVLVKRIEVIGN